MRRHESFGTILIGKSVLIREGIVRILRAKNFRILASVSCLDELTSSARSQQLLFLIVHTSDDFDLAIEQIELVRGQYPSGRIVVVADHYRQAEPDLAFQAGAAGYFISAMSCDAFVKSIELVMMGETVFPPAFQSPPSSAIKGDRRDKAAPLVENERAIIVTTETVAAPHLSPRELVILRCLIEGNSNKGIARKIDIAEATVKVHVKAILRKIRVQNRTQAAIWGMNNVLPVQPANNNSLLPAVDANDSFSNSIALVSAVKRIGVP